MKRILSAPIIIGLLILISTSTANVAFAFDAQRDDIRAFVKQLVKKHDFDARYVEKMLDESESKQKILDAISRPAERTLAWHEYRNIFITPERIAAGVRFREEQRDRLERIAAQTGVPPEMLAAIVGVETYYGTRTGSWRVLDALATLGFDYPPRAKFFRRELEELFVLAREEELELDEMLGSYAGAMGPPQFIPSSYRAYAVDGDGDGRRDLLGNWDDILTSVANYFTEHGWRDGEPVALVARTDGSFRDSGKENSLKMTETIGSLGKRGVHDDADLPADTRAQLISMDGKEGREFWIGMHNFYVITRYNRSSMYALAVFQLSQALAEAWQRADESAATAMRTSEQ